LFFLNSILSQTCEELLCFGKEKSLILCGLWRFANVYVVYCVCGYPQEAILLREDSLEIMVVDKKRCLQSYSLGNNSYYIQLVVISIIGFVFLLCRSRLGVDLTDETWYTSDPYWVAKGSTPYVNNWTQASGFTLPLFVLYSVFLELTDGNEGIILFSRILYCVWKPAIIALSFGLLKKSKIDAPSIFALPIIVFNPGQLFAINYNSIGIAYVLLAFSVLAISFNDNGELSHKQEFLIGVVCGFIMGRSVIGTPATVAACLVILIFLACYKKILTLKGFIFGGILAAIAVITFCCIRGGIKNFVIGIQYFLRDINYYDSIKKHGVAPTDSTSYLWNYLIPAVITLGMIVFLKFLLKNKEQLFNKIVLLFSCGTLFCAFYYFSKYSGTGASIAEATKYGWFISILCLFFKFRNSEKRKTIQFFSFYVISAILIYTLQGYISTYGFGSRSYWNFISLMVGICCIYFCVGDMYEPEDLKKNICRVGVIGVACVATFIVMRGAYRYVYRDMPIEKLATKVESGVWKGCYTTAQRAGTVVEIENELRKRTEEDDQVLCWGGWACFMNLLCDGKLCSASPLGTGAKNGFDFWHMYQVVPNKIFVRVDEDDSEEIMSYSRPVWVFISKFYQETDEIDYTSYNDSGDPIYYRVVEYDISDYDSALSYADDMATVVFDFE